MGIRTPSGMAPVPPIDNRRRREPPPPIPTLADLRRHTSWTWVNCTNIKCMHYAPVAYAPLIIRWGPDASSDVLRRSARCTRCGRKGATLLHPSHKDLMRDWAPFPTDRRK